jgi:hypothetical protein
MSLTIISYGGGVQSTAMLVLANQGELGYDVDAAVFANVGERSEHPETLKYVREWATTVSTIPVVEVAKRRKSGEIVDLRDQLERPETRSVEIPVYLRGGGPGRRSCTGQWKIVPIGKWLKANGATEEKPATVCIGISTDEIQRVNRKKAQPYEKAVYPLIELGLDRSECVQIIEKAGWPNPGKSACYYCPFHRPQHWAEMRRDEPELFASVVELERTIGETRQRIAGERDAYLTRFGMPIDEAIGEAQDELPLWDGEWPECDEGACWV